MNITFKKVTFSYHEDPLLKDVDFTWEKRVLLVHYFKY